MTTRNKKAWQKTASDLAAARKLIEKPEHWAKGKFSGMNLRGERWYCALGAVNNVVLDSSTRYARCGAALVDCLPRKCNRNVAVFNDARRTEHADVLRLFDDAIAYANGKAA